jgi:glycosyltransferase involved in cell wall biosynthesis
MPEGAAMAEKISCLVVTCDRPAHLARSYACYRDQTYPDKELVIVTDEAGPYVEFIRRLTADARDVRVVALPERQPLGALRNRAVLASTGDVLCQWDDDDLCHPERLAVQYARMANERADAAFFVDQLQLFWENRIAYWTDWGAKRRRARRGGDPRPWLIPGTLMCRLGAMPEYPALARGEDTVVKNRLCGAGARVAEVDGLGWLSIYAYHGKNTYDRTHHDRIHEVLAKPAAQVRDDQDLLAAALARYACLDPPIALLGRGDEPAFIWSGKVPAARGA